MNGNDSKQVFVCDLDEILADNPQETQEFVEEFIRLDEHVGLNVRANLNKSTGNIFPTVWMHVLNDDGSVRLKLFYPLVPARYKTQYGGHNEARFLNLFEKVWTRIKERFQAQLREDGSESATRENATASSQNVPF